MLEKVLDITGSAMSANRFWLERVANNLANANTTRTPEGGAYRRQVPVFQELVDQEISGHSPAGVGVVGVSHDPTPLPKVYRPGHPDADKDGFLVLPNVNVVTEMVDMIAASRAYEANITLNSAAKNMMTKALEIGK
jgi:flagellar basal-body rod protein FlgC